MLLTLPPRSVRRLRAAGLVGVLGIALSGCSGTGRADSASSTATLFEHAVTAGDGAVACELLAPGTAQEVAQAAGSDCANAIVKAELPTAGAVQEATAWGRSAQVRMASDTLFMSHFDDGWKVLAAGCTPQPGKPYDCTVQGG